MKKIISLVFVALFAFTAFAEYVPSPSIELIEDPIMELAEFIGVECVEVGEVEIAEPSNVHKYFVIYETDTPQIVCVQPNKARGKSYTIAQEDIAPMFTIIVLIHMYYNVPAIVVWDEAGIYNWEIQEIMNFLSEIA